MKLYFVGTKAEHLANSYQAVSNDKEAATQLAREEDFQYVWEKEVDVRPRRKRKRRRHV
jgi:hypothetical protein